MDFTWKRPKTREEYIHYVNKPDKVLENAFWMSLGNFVPLDIWCEIFSNLFEDFTPDENEPISFVNKYFNSPVQMKKNPFIVWERNHILGLFAEPFSDAWKLKLATAFDVDVPEMLSYDASYDKHSTWNNCPKRMVTCSCELINYTQSENAVHGDVPRTCELLLGIWIPQLTTIKDAYIEFHYSKCCLSIDLKTPVFKMDDGVVYRIPDIIVPIVALSYDSLTLHVSYDDIPHHPPKIIGCILDTEIRKSKHIFDVQTMGNDLILVNGFAAPKTVAQNFLLTSRSV